MGSMRTRAATERIDWRKTMNIKTLFVTQMVNPGIYMLNHPVISGGTCPDWGVHRLNLNGKR